MQELGLDCVAWAPAVYHDLLRSGDGTAEGIVAAYFGMVRAAPSYFHCAVPTSAFSLSMTTPCICLLLHEQKATKLFTSARTKSYKTFDKRQI